MNEEFKANPETLQIVLIYFKLIAMPIIFHEIFAGTLELPKETKSLNLVNLGLV